MSSQFEAKEKQQFVAELLAKDKLMSPAKIVTAITKKFGTGISRVDVARIRLANHGIRLGPGGFAMTQNGAAAARPDDEDATKRSNARLGRIVAELQAEMRLQQVTAVTIPDHGPIETVQTVRRTIQLD
jgi:hypothetical protein